MAQLKKTHTPTTNRPTTIIRPATNADARALRRLAELDSAPELAGEVLLAERAGEVVAAIAIESGATIADPFQRTAPITVMLVVQRRDLIPVPAPARRWRRLRVGHGSQDLPGLANARA